jgi:metal-responsive CopG/Arc/MetJ family transcriptional regulator
MGGSYMRVYAPLEDQVVSELDQAAEQKGFSRAQMIIKAVYSYLHQPEPSTEDLDQLRSSWINRLYKLQISEMN